MIVARWHNIRVARSDQFRQRLITHHLPLLVVSALSVAALYVTRPYRDVISRLSFATAYPALILLGITLLLGPLRVLRRKPNPVSDDLRRDIGIWAGIVSVVHAVVGQCVHLRGRPWLYYVYAKREHHSFPIRHDLFGFSNYTGLVGTLLIIVLLATSNDYFLRRLGKPQWKRLQRWNYAASLLAAAHAIGYQATEKQKLPFVLVVALCIGLTIIVQGIGYAARRRALAPSARVQNEVAV